MTLDEYRECHPEDFERRRDDRNDDERRGEYVELAELQRDFARRYWLGE